MPTDAQRRNLASAHHALIAQHEATILWQSAEISKHIDKIALLESVLMQAREALESLHQWSNAYPISVFPEPDFEKSHELLKAGGMTLDAISASNMRHVVNEVGRIVEPFIDAIDAAIASTQEQT